MVPDDKRHILLRIAFFIFRNIQRIFAGQSGICVFTDCGIIHCFGQKFCHILNTEVQCFICADNFPGCYGEVSFIDTGIAVRCDFHLQGVSFNCKNDSVILIALADFIIRSADQACAVVEDIEVFCFQFCNRFRIADCQFECIDFTVARTDSCVSC